MGKKNKEYIFDPLTLDYRESVVTWRERLRMAGLMFFVSIAVSFFYLWLYTVVFGQELPKTIILKKQNAEWNSQMSILNTRMDDCQQRLESLQLRDDGVYRAIFGLPEISKDERYSGIGGVNRYEYLIANDHTGLLASSVKKLDFLTKMAFVQSKSYDEVDQMAKRSGDIASCVPAVPPFYPGSRYRISSSFGIRRDPVYHTRRMHQGVDFAMDINTPIYAVGDGTVELVRRELYGYGNSIIINHGFGYKTRYAHMKTINLIPGMSVKRGDCIGLSGNSGKSTGPHLHFEVMYRGRFVNPMNYMDIQIPLDEYVQMIKAREEETGMSSDLIQPVHKDRKTIRKREKKK